MVYRNKRRFKMAATQTHVKTFVVPDELKALLKEYPALRVDDKKGKVCCCLTGHEMPLREDVVCSFVQGKKFQKAQGQREYDYEQHKPHLVPNTKRKFQHTLFCTLTLRTVVKRPEDVERHVNGKRYQRALKRWQRCQETGEKFKPRGGRQRRGDSVGPDNESASESGKAKGFWELGSGDEDDGSDDDTLDDLYPSEDFASESEEEDKDAENGCNMAAGKDEEASDSDSDTADVESKNVINGQSSLTVVKRKKSQKPGGKKKRT